MVVVRPSPRLFLSYARGDAAHQDTVRAWAEGLRLSGFDVAFDEWADDAVVSWPRWMEAQVLGADLVVAVVSRAWVERFEGRLAPERGYGVRYEGELLRSRLYRGGRVGMVIVRAPDLGDAPLPLVLDGLPTVPLEAGVDSLVAVLGSPGSQRPLAPAPPPRPWVNPWRALVVVASRRPSGPAEALAHRFDATVVTPEDPRVAEAAVIAFLGTHAPSTVPPDREVVLLDPAASEGWDEDVRRAIRRRDRAWVGTGDVWTRTCVAVGASLPAIVGLAVDAGVGWRWAAAAGVVAAAATARTTLVALSRRGGDPGFWHRLDPSDVPRFVREGLLRSWGVARAAPMARDWLTHLVLVLAPGWGILAFGGLGPHAFASLGWPMLVGVVLGVLSAVAWTWLRRDGLRRGVLLAVALTAWQVTALAEFWEFLPSGQMRAELLWLQLRTPVSPALGLAWVLAAPGWVGLGLELPALMARPLAVVGQGARAARIAAASAS